MKLTLEHPIIDATFTLDEFPLLQRILAAIPEPNRTYHIRATSDSPEKISAIKAVRAILGCTLKAGKDYVEGTPLTLTSKQHWDLSDNIGPQGYGLEPNQ